MPPSAIAAMADAVAMSILVLLIFSPRAAASKMVPNWSLACSMFCAGAELVAGSTQGVFDRTIGTSTAAISETDTLELNWKVAPTAIA